VHFVKDDPIERVKGRRTRIDHVAEHFSGHDDNRRVAIYCGVASEEPNSLFAVLVNQVMKLLVRKRFDRRRVKGTPSCSKRDSDSVFSDFRFPRSSRGRHKDRQTAINDRNRILLELIELE
jgi:hypothetical protein